MKTPSRFSASGLRLGIDLGTGSLKLMASFPGPGAGVGSGGTGPEFTASRPYVISAPAQGRAETNPEEWVTALRASWEELRQKLEAAGLDTAISSIGLGGQMHGFVPVDASGRALTPAILWADARGTEFLGEFDRIDTEARERLMNAPAAGMAAVTILWLKRYQPTVYAATKAFLFPKDYLRFRLTGGLATDPGDASAGLVYDFAKETWSTEVLDKLGIDVGKLPPIRGSFEVAGQVSARGAADTGLPEGCPVAVGSSDGACSLYGCGLFPTFFGSSINDSDRPTNATSMGDDWSKPSASLISVGSGAQVFVPVRGLPPYNPGLNCFETAFPGIRFRMAAMLNGGVALEWVRSMVGIEWDAFYADFDAGRIQVPQDLVFLPWLTGERSPYGDPAARGAWIGLGLHHSKAELLAAALLGVACSVRLGAETLALVPETTAYFVGGSSRRPSWCSLLASVLGRPLEVCSVSDSSARGAAFLGAAAAAGGSPDSISPPPRPGTSTTPPTELTWLERHYRRFTRSWSALYGEGGIYSSD